MHKELLTLLSAACMVFAGSAAIAQDRSPESAVSGSQSPQHFQAQLSHAANLDYLLFLPEGYSRSDARRWPLLLFLHGAGERGSNLEKVTVHGPPKLVKTKKDFPFVLVSPQCPDERIWRDDELLAMLDSVIARHNIDPNRVYLTGLSMGGYGSWSLGTRRPDRFAAIAPICGGGDLIPVLLATSQQKAAFKTLGVWAFHGGKDTVVPLEESQRMTNLLTRAGCNDVKLTVYPDAGHDSWTQAYNDPELWTWMLAHERGKAEPAR